VENARLTLLYMGMILGIMFIGITYLARVYHIVPEEGQTAVSLGTTDFREWTFLLLYPSCHTVNLTSSQYQLCGLSQTLLLLARDGFCPRQLSLLGDRLVYLGIILLSLCAAVLVVIFRGKLTQYPLAVVYLLHLPCPKLGWYAAGSNSGHQVGRLAP